MQDMPNPSFDPSKMQGGAENARTNMREAMRDGARQSGGGSRTRGRFYSVAMPLAAILYVIIGLVVGGAWWGIGALLLAVVAVAGLAVGGSRG
jgi:hypothetical protein